MTRGGAPPVALVAGGLHEPIGATEFWEAPGVAPALRGLGHRVHLLGRSPAPRSWEDEAAHLAEQVERIEAGRAALVAAADGCSAVLRLALDRPELVDRLILCWPATGDDPEVDRAETARLRRAGVDDATCRRLVDGGIARGVTAAELARVAAPTVVVPAEPEDARHARRTVAALRRTLPRATLGLGTPPSVHPTFAGHLPALVALLDVVLTG